MSESSMQIDEETESEFFKLHSENQIPLSVVLAEWHPDKDLLIMVTEDGKIVLHRLNWDRLWTISPGKKVTSICWRPDGKALAVGLEDGTVSLYDVENGKMLRSNKSHSAAVVCLSWAEEDELELGDPYDLFSYEDRTARFFPPPRRPPPNATVKPHVASGVSGSVEDQDGVDEDFINSSRQQLNILCSGDKEGIICFSIFGVYPVGKMNIGELLVISSQDGLPQDNGTAYRLYNASLCKMALSNDLRQIIVLCNGTLTEGMDSSMEDTQDRIPGLYCLRINTSIFQKRHKELYQVALHVSSIERLFELFSSSLKVIQKQWSDTMHSFRSSFTMEVPWFGVVKTLDMKNDLVDLLCGDLASQQLRKFFADYGEGALKGLARRIDTACKDIHKIIVEHLQAAAEIIAFRVGELKGLSRWHSRLQSIGLDERLIDHAMEDAGMLIIQIERLLRILSETLYLFHNFFNWLKETLKHEPGEQIPVINSELVMLFLNTIFEQDHIAQHLELLQEDTKVDIDPNALRRLEELVEFGGFSDVYYLRRTLSCQFDCLQRSCKEAFSMPFTILSQKLFCEDIMLLSYVPQDSRMIKFKEPISIAYYKELEKGHSQDIESKSILRDYICFQTFNATTPDNCSAIVIVRGFTHGGRFHHSKTNNKEIEVTAFCIQKGFHLIDLALYKENKVILLVNDENSTSVVAKLMLLQTNSFPFVSFSTVSENICLLDRYRSKEAIVELHVEDGIVQLVPHSMVASLAVSASRGLACVFTSQRRAMVYFLEEDEGEGEDEDGDKDD